MITSKDKILTAALDMWRTDRKMPTVRALATQVGVTHSAILYHWKTAGLLQNALAMAAVNGRDAVLVPILIVTGHPAVSLLSADERTAFLNAH